MAELEDSSSGDSTDVCSEKFDSFKTLYSENVRVPVPEAPIFDNLSKFESVVLKGQVIKVGNDATANFSLSSHLSIFIQYTILIYTSQSLFTPQLLSERHCLLCIVC